MSKKKYLHIAEFDLTKLILDKLDIDIEDDFTLLTDISIGCDPLQFKSKYLVLPTYEKVDELDSDSILFKPFSILDHSNYLLNLFTDYSKYDSTVFEYKDGEDGTYNGVLKIFQPYSNPYNIRFNGITNIATLQTTLILKDLLDYDVFKKCIGKIFKIDKKLSENKK